MANRIPDKNTDRRGYQRYHRDKRVLGEISALIDTVGAITKDTDEHREDAYCDAVKALVAARAAFEKGWKL